MRGDTSPCPRMVDEPRSDTFPVAEAHQLFDENDVGGFVDEALDENPPVPIIEGTVQIRRFESPRLRPIQAASPPKAAPPSWLVQLADVVPARHEKAFVAAILFFFLFGVLSFVAGVTMLLFVL